MQSSTLRNVLLVGPTIALLTLIGGRGLFAYPGDVFQTAAPTQAPSSSETAESKAAHPEHSVSAAGAAQYAIPITVPPGRNGIQPNLAITYSSRNPVRGGIASGWQMAIPLIDTDTSTGRLAGTTYLSTLSGTRLITVDEPGADPGVQTYRAENDASYTRYQFYPDPVDQHKPGSWRALTTDGRTYYFGETLNSRDEAEEWVIGYARSARWFVTRIVDGFGNEAVFHYERVVGGASNGDAMNVPVDIALTSIEYGGNPGAGVEPQLAVDFEYAPAFDLCNGSFVPIGAQFDFRRGMRLYEGARRLLRVTTRAMDLARDEWAVRRQLELSYDEDELTCAAGKLHAPLRLLTQVRERAWAPDGSLAEMPPMTFTYGPLEHQLRSEMYLPNEVISPDIEGEVGRGKRRLNTTKAGGWPTIDAMWIDFDGDGMTDIVRSVPQASATDCGYKWRRNLGGGQFEPTWQTGTLPALPWSGGAARNDTTERDDREGCSLAAQFSRRDTIPLGDAARCGTPANYTSYRFMDMNSDGRPDLVTALDFQKGRYRPDQDAALDAYGELPSCTGVGGACADPNGNTIACSMTPAQITQQSGNGDDEDPYDPVFCPNNTGCTFPGETCMPPDCPCSEAYCGNDPDQAWSEWSPPLDHDLELNAGFHGNFAYPGAPYFNGPIGNEDQVGGQLGSQLCGQAPEMHCDRYVWRIYWNEGDGQLSAEPTIHLSPIPLESDRPTSRLGNSNLAASSSWHGFIDIDGDGFTDAVWQDPVGHVFGYGPTGRFLVFRGDGAGNFSGDANGDAYEWPVPYLEGDGGILLRARVNLSGSHVRNNTDTTALRYTDSQVTMTDINGDGLPDYVDTREMYGDGKLVRVFYNTGAGFESDGYGTVLHDGLETMSREEQQVLRKELDTFHMDNGWSRASLRPVDLDGDGLLDVVSIQTPVVGVENPWSLLSQGSYLVNVGDRLVDMGSPSKLIDWLPGLARITISAGEQWKVKTDFVDFNGDGIEDLYNNDDNTSQCEPDPSNEWTISTLCGRSSLVLTDVGEESGQSMRLLQRVDNGRGGAVEFTYASSIDASVVVTDVANGDRVPYAYWVVGEVDVSPGVQADGTFPDWMTTTYRYAHPVYNLDNQGRHGFRGFELVDTYGPSGALERTRYDYVFDWRGRDVEQIVYADPGDLDRPHSMSETTWKRFELFDGAIVTYHAIESRARVCGSTGNATTCRATAPFVRTASQWTAQAPTHPSGGVPVAWVQQTSVTSSAASDTIGDRKTVVVSSIYYGPDDYRVRTASTAKYEIGAGNSLILAGRVDSYYDDDGLVELSTGVYMDAGTIATTTRTFDMETGNLLSEQKPQQLGTSAFTEYAYSDERMYVRSATNAFDHVVETDYDLATGALLEMRGPNHVDCGGTCDALNTTRNEIDGFGRPVQLWVSVDDAIDGYRLELVARTSYRDFAYVDSSEPTSTTAEHRIEYGGTRWVATTTELDGLGRVIRSTGANPDGNDAITTFEYAAAGPLIRVTAPNPSAGGGTSTVEFSFEHDTLGRTTAAHRPDQTGQTVAYDGLATTRTDLVFDGGPAASTRVVNDAFGRLAEVHELLDGGDWATTTYGYDANDNLVSVIDADGIETSMSHDLAGNRLSITRADGTWTYTYDLNGNLIAIRSPVPYDGDVLDYTTSIAYDELDRVSSRIVGERDLTPDQLARFGDGYTELGYGTSGNATGRLQSVSLPFGTLFTDYDALGNPVAETLDFDLAPLGATIADERTLRRELNALGAVTDVWHADAGTGSSGSPTHTVTTYDSRGLPAGAKWLQSGGGTVSLATMAYSTAGSPIGRTDSASPSRQLQRWTYDELGRVLSTDVRARLSPNKPWRTKVDHRSTYFDADDVSSLTTSLDGGLYEQFAFVYDSQHQLIDASGASGYTASFGYTPGGRFDFATIDANPVAPEVQSRNVDYFYGGHSGPEAVDELREPGGGSFASYRYDAAGNVTEREQGSNSWQFVYDGDNRQREAISPDGRTETYYYDHAGTRLLALERDSAGFVTTARLWFGSTEIHYDKKNNVSTTRAHVDLAGPVARIEDRSAVVRTYHDEFGHMLVALDQAGTIKAGYTYGPFGEILQTAGTYTDDFRRRFNGKESDELSGLNYYGFRYYDPLSLTWTQADPLYRFAPDIAYDQPRRMALYTFSLNNAMRFVDPNGLKPIDEEELAGTKSEAEFRKETRTVNEATERGPKPDVTDLSTEQQLEFLVSLAPCFGDWAGLGLSLEDFARHPSLFSGANVVLDVFGAALPFVPALGTIRRTDHAIDALRAVDPNTIRFTQDSMRRTFSDGRTVRALVDDLKAMRLTAKDLPPIRVFERNGKIFTLDNRRLKAFQEAGVAIRVTAATAEEILAEVWKFTTKNGGTSIRVRGGGL